MDSKIFLKIGKDHLWCPPLWLKNSFSLLLYDFVIFSDDDDPNERAKRFIVLATIDFSLGRCAACALSVGLSSPFDYPHCVRYIQFFSCAHIRSFFDCQTMYRFTKWFIFFFTWNMMNIRGVYSNFWLNGVDSFTWKSHRPLTMCLIEFKKINVNLPHIELDVSIDDDEVKRK